MDNMIVIDNLSFKYDKNVVFKNLSLSIKKGSFTTVLGNNGSGKSTLVRLLTGVLRSNSIFIDGKLLCDKSIGFIRSKIGVVFENPDICLVSETVMDNLAFPLEGMNYSSDYIFSRINEVSSYLGISHLLNRSSSSLSGGEKQLVSLGCALVTGPSLIILDEALSMLDDMSRVNILMYLRRINKDFGVTILNITHDIEESVYGDDILIIDRGVLIHDAKEKVYENEKLLRNNGFDLPFMVSLSNKLSYYDMVDSIIFDMDEMVDLLWK